MLSLTDSKKSIINNTTIRGCILTFINSLKKIRYIIFVITIFSILSLPLVVQVGLNKKNDNIEKRNLASFPSFSVTNLSNYPKEFEAYFNDHFGLRQLLVRYYNIIKIKVFNVSPNPLIILGKNGWLFFAGNDAINHYRGIAKFSDGELLKIKIKLESIQNHLKKSNIPFLIIFAPDKESIYPEFLPNTIIKEQPTNKLDQLVDYLQKNSNLDFIDLRKKLLDNKDSKLLYYKTDSHWNNLGAFYAYIEIMDHVKAYFPNVNYKTFADYNDTAMSIDKSPHDLTLYLAMTDLYQDYKVDFIPKFVSQSKILISEPGQINPQKLVLSTGNPTHPNLLMLRDSFTNSLIPFLTESFNKSTYYWKFILNEDEFKEAKPNIVFFEIVERNLAELTN